MRDVLAFFQHTFYYDFLGFIFQRVAGAIWVKYTSCFTATWKLNSMEDDDIFFAFSGQDQTFFIKNLKKCLSYFQTCGIANLRIPSSNGCLILRGKLVEIIGPPMCMGLFEQGLSIIDSHAIWWALVWSLNYSLTRDIERSISAGLRFLHVLDLWPIVWIINSWAFL